MLTQSSSINMGPMSLAKSNRVVSLSTWKAHKQYTDMYCVECTVKCADYHCTCVTCTCRAYLLHLFYVTWLCLCITIVVSTRYNVHLLHLRVMYVMFMCYTCCIYTLYLLHLRGTNVESKCITFTLPLTCTVPQ